MPFNIPADKGKACFLIALPVCPFVFASDKIDESRPVLKPYRPFHPEQFPGELLDKLLEAIENVT